MNFIVPNGAVIQVVIEPVVNK